jgi:hypothetical protein
MKMSLASTLHTRAPLQWGHSLLGKRWTQCNLARIAADLLAELSTPKICAFRRETAEKPHSPTVYRRWSG